LDKKEVITDAHIAEALQFRIKTDL